MSLHGKMTQSVHSISFRSDDAILEEDGGFTFTASAAAAGRKPNRVQLGSIELPIQQMSIEPEWSRIGLMERIAPTPAARTIEVRRDYPTRNGTRAEAVSLALPLGANKIVDSSWSNGTLTVQTEHPHGLWGEGGRCLVPQ